ncbi:MAG: hypothetical protein ACYDHZ_01000 [Dehalococcoidia bacterium]
MVRCLICEKHPAKTHGLCLNCYNKAEKQARADRPETYYRFAQYRGTVVGFFRTGRATFVPRLLQRNPATLPKSKTFDLDGYVQGFDRTQIKKIKAAILQLTSIH